MYLVSAEKFSTEARKNLNLLFRPKRRKREKQHPYDKWAKFRKTLGEAEITRKTRKQAIADFLQKVLPEHASSRTETVVKKKKKQPPTLPSRDFDVGTKTEPVAIPSTSAVYETPKPSFTFE